MDDDIDFLVSDVGRKSQVFSGKICSFCGLMNDKEERDKFLAANPEAIGGEMEGGELQSRWRTQGSDAHQRSS